MLKCLIECTIKKENRNIIGLLRNKALKTLQLKFNGSSQIHMNVQSDIYRGLRPKQVVPIIFNKELTYLGSKASIVMMEFWSIVQIMMCVLHR